MSLNVLDPIGLSSLLAFSLELVDLPPSLSLFRCLHFFLPVTALISLYAQAFSGFTKFVFVYIFLSLTWTFLASDFFISRDAPNLNLPLPLPSFSPCLLLRPPPLLPPTRQRPTQLTVSDSLDSLSRTMEGEFAAVIQRRGREGGKEK